MKKIIFFLAMILLVSAAYAALPPHATFTIDYDELGISNASLTGEFLECQEEITPLDREILPQLNINQYDEKNNCYWAPVSYGGGYCEANKCDFFSIPVPKAKFAVYVEELDQVFITNELIIYTDRNYLEVELLADGSATLIRTKENGSNVQWWSFVIIGLLYYSIPVFIILAIAAIIWYVIHKRKKAKKK